MVEISAGNNPLAPTVDRKRIACKGFDEGKYSYVKGRPELSDTLETRKWIRGHNAAYRKLKCPEE